MKKDDNTGLIILTLVVGLPIYLLMTYPFIFWLVFVPLALLGIIKFITWLKK